MAVVTVYAFTIYNPKNDSYERARGMAPEQVITQIEGASIIRTESKQVDDSELTETHRYHDNK